MKPVEVDAIDRDGKGKNKTDPRNLAQEVDGLNDKVDTALKEIAKVATVTTQHLNRASPIRHNNFCQKSFGNNHTRNSSWDRN